MCDKCGVSHTKDSGNMTYGGNMIFGKNGNICLDCHTFKHTLMSDPNLRKSCDFCAE